MNGAKVLRRLMAAKLARVCLLVLIGSTPVAAQEGEPYASPIVFQRLATNGTDQVTSDSYAEASIWIMEHDGSRQQIFRAHEGKNLDHPSLSKGLGSVVYAEFEQGSQSQGSQGQGSQGPGGRARLLTESIGLKPDGSAVRRVLRNVHTCSVHQASLSPVTEELTYMRHCDGGTPPALISEMNYEIRNVSLETKGLRASHGVGLENAVVFQAEETREDGSLRSAIAIVRYDEEGKGTYSELTDRTFRHQSPAVSPDGQWIVWQSSDSETGSADLFLARVDGREARRLTRSPAYDGHPWFSRDGRQIVFESDRSGHWEIYTLEIATGKVVQLTDDPALVSRAPRF